MDLIEDFGKKMDEFLTEANVWLKIKMPSGTQEVEIESNLGDVATVDFYILLKAMEKTMRLLDASVNPDKKEAMIDGMIELVKADLMDEEAAADEKKSKAGSSSHHGSLHDLSRIDSV